MKQAPTKKRYYKSRVDLDARIESLDGEIWKPIPGFTGYYEVSNLGRVKRLATSHVTSNGRHNNRPENILKIHYSKVKGREYGHVTLCVEGINKQCTVHRLVASAFIPNPDNKQEVNHIDGNKNNNCVENLEWATRAENMLHARTKGLIIPKIGNQHFRSKAVVMYDLKTHAKLATFESAHIAGVLLTEREDSAAHIIEVCKGQREYAYGYFWRYREEETVTTIKNQE